MLIRFTKMHGLGNDFMIVDLVSQHAHISSEQVKALADRHTGIGFDQLLIVEIPRSPKMDFRYRIFNADGSEVEQCGNGARCFARFVYDKKLTHKKCINVETAGGNIVLNINDDNSVTVDMGAPRLEPAQIPFTAPSEAKTYALDVEGQNFDICAVSMGNPHAVLLVDDVDCADVERLGPLIESHPAFPARCNVGFMQIIDRENFKLRVYERGAGETMACGTGACAAMVAARLRGLVDSKASAHLRGGELQLEWTQPGEPVMMTGSATRVYEGQTKL